MDALLYLPFLFTIFLIIISIPFSLPLLSLSHCFPSILFPFFISLPLAALSLFPLSRPFFLTPYISNAFYSHLLLFRTCLSLLSFSFLDSSHSVTSVISLLYVLCNIIIHLLCFILLHTYLCIIYWYISEPYILLYLHVLIIQ